MGEEVEREMVEQEGGETVEQPVEEPGTESGDESGEGDGASTDEAE